MSQLTFHLIPHTHWDREWYLPRGHFGARLIPVIDDLVALLEREPAIPGFLLDGQTVLLEDYLRVRPDQRGRLSRLVAGGRIETGPWYVLADEQIPSGESLIRNLQLGAADRTSLGGGMKVLYSPDAFGHPAVLPALAREFGIESGVVWRGLQSATDLLRWRGPDGRTILMYHLPPDGYEIGSGLSSDNGTARRAWEPVRRALVARAASPHVAVFVGADHHAARADLTRLRDSIAELEPGHEVRLSRLEDFLQRVSNIETVPVRSGELRHHGYTWTLQGVHGTRSHQKRRNSRLELWLERYAEPLIALGTRQNGRDRRPRLNWAWRSLVQGQFHDAIGGCASDAVAREVDARHAEVEGIARELVRESLQQLTGWDPDRARESPDQVHPSLLIWNPAPRPREGIVLAQVTRFHRDVLVGPPGNRIPRTGQQGESFALRTESGESIPVQVLGTGIAHERLDAARHYPDQDEVELIRVAFEAPTVAGLSSQILSLVAGQESPRWGGAAATGRRISNEHLEIEVGRDGSLRVTHRETGKRHEGLLRFESESDGGDTYTVSPGRPPGVRRMKAPVKVRTLASGPMVAALEAVGRLNPPTNEDGTADGFIETKLLVLLFRDDPIIRCTLRLHNQRMNHRFRARFSTGGGGGYAVAGAQFGTVIRPPVVDRPHIMESPVATAPAHRFVGLPGDAGLAIFAPGFFEYELEPSGELLFTVLRAVGQLSRGDLPTRPGHAGWPTATPMAQCLGADTLDFAFALGEGWEDPARLYRSWEDLFLPLKPVWIRDWNGGDESLSGIELDGDGLALSAVQPAQRSEGIVVRCFNLRDEVTSGLLTFRFPVKRAQRVLADETVLSDLSGEHQQEVRFVAQPREIVSILIT